VDIVDRDRTTFDSLCGNWKARDEPGLSRLAISAADSSNEPTRYAGLQSASAVGAARVLLALSVVALAVMFGGGTMRLGSVFVVFSSLVVLFFCHGNPLWLLAPSRHKLAVSGNVPTTGKTILNFTRHHHEETDGSAWRLPGSSRRRRQKNLKKAPGKKLRGLQKTSKLVEVGDWMPTGKDQGFCWSEQYWPASPELKAHAVFITVSYRHL
jgi:hypothetical protein